MIQTLGRAIHDNPISTTLLAGLGYFYPRAALAGLTLISPSVVLAAGFAYYAPRAFLAANVAYYCIPPAFRALGSVFSALTDEVEIRPLRNRVERIQARPVPARVVPQRQPVEEIPHLLMANSLFSFLTEDLKRKLEQEKQYAAAGPIVPRGERKYLDVPEGETCALTCGEIPPEYAVKIHDCYFDVRYFVKAMLTLTNPDSPYTKNPLTQEELQQITDTLGIEAGDFLLVWEWTESYAPLLKEIAEHTIEAQRSEILREISSQMGAPRSIEGINQLSSNAGVVLSSVVKERLRDYKTQLREERLMQLLEVAVVKGKISSEFCKSVEDALKWKSENPLNAQGG